MIKIGEVFKVTYIVFLRTKKKKKKVYNFIGLCTNFNKHTFVLNNNFRGENIKITFDIRSPIIVRFIKVKIYPSLNFRVSRLFFIKKFNFYKEDYSDKNNNYISNLNSIKFDYFYSAYLKKKIKRFKKKLRKFKRKYSYTENWKALRHYKLEKEYQEDDYQEDAYII